MNNLHHSLKKSFRKTVAMMLALSMIFANFNISALAYTEPVPAETGYPSEQASAVSEIQKEEEQAASGEQQTESGGETVGDASENDFPDGDIMLDSLLPENGTDELPEKEPEEKKLLLRNCGSF